MTTHYIEFVGGPLDGNTLSGERAESFRFVAGEGKIGAKFWVGSTYLHRFLDEVPEKVIEAEWLVAHVYEVFERDIEPNESLIRCRYVGPHEQSGPIAERLKPHPGCVIVMHVGGPLDGQRRPDGAPEMFGTTITRICLEPQSGYPMRIARYRFDEAVDMQTVILYCRFVDFVSDEQSPGG